jgi:hypothetical protein
LGQPTILEWALADEIEAATFTNLLMLEFNPALMEREHATSFDGRMFRKTNAKGMEIVLHLLNQQGSDQPCAQELTLVWPIFDQPSARGFRKLATSLLQVAGAICLRCHTTVQPLHDCTHAPGRAHRTYLLSSVAPEE